MAETTDTRDAIDAAVGGTAKPFSADGDMIVLPEGYHIDDLEAFRDVPRRIVRAATLVTLKSFTNYIDRHKNGNTSVYGRTDENGGVFVAVFDDHGKDAPAHCGHRVTFSPTFSLEWRRWSGLNGMRVSQVEFARFLEDYHDDVVEPDGATLLEIAHTLEAKKGVEFQSGVKLHDGTNQLKFVETQEARAGVKGDIDVPPTIVIGVPVFDGDEPRLVDCFLRYRIDAGALSFIVEIKDAERVVRDQVDVMSDKISGHVSHVYSGTP